MIQANFLKIAGVPVLFFGKIGVWGDKIIEGM
jgi:hypothetical protein